MQKVIKTPETDLKVGQKVYFEDSSHEGKGVIFFIPTGEKMDLLIQLNGEPCISIQPNKKALRARFVPISQIILL